MLLSSCVDTLFVIPLSATTEWPPTVSNQSPINESTGINIPSSYFGVTINSSANFTIVVLGDMQHYYYQDPPELPYQIFYNITRWIANNTRTNNIVFVGQVGDITDNLAGQMPIASYCMDFIEDPATTGLTDGIPYLAIIGNDHDVENKFNSYFGIANFSDKSYYGGHYGSDNYNSWVNFSASGMNFIVVGLPYNESGHYMNVAWADNLLQNYSDRRAIVISHDVLNSVDLERDGIEINATLNHNQNLFLMLCGHNKQQTQKTITSNGHTVYAIQSDYSAFYPGDPDKTGYIRLMQFCPTENKIHVKTYSPYLDAWQTGSDHQFDLDYDMSGATSPQMNITWQTNASGNWETFNTTTNVNNGTYYAYNTSWVNQYNTKYYWRVLVDDGNGGWRNETYYFTTGSQTINAPTVTTNSSTGVEETNATLWGYLQNNGSADTTCGFWYDTTSGGTTNNQSIGTVSNSTLFSYNASVLAPGQLYFFKAWTSNSAGFNGTSNELTFLTKPNATTGFTARANSSTMIYLSWTNGTGANNTYIERNAVSSWVRGAGTLVYNGTGINYENTSLSANTTYYYQAWSYTSWAGLTQWSDLNASANNRTNSLLVISDPAPNGSSIHFPISTSSLTIQINDSEGDAFNWTIETSPNIGNASGFGAQNGTKTCTISGLSYSTTYYWFVNATDVGSGKLRQ